MPHVKVKTRTGAVEFHYTISTPKSHSASKIDKKLPVVLFLHPVYIGQELFHPQFADPRLRRFNLVAMDSRLHGQTRGNAPSNFNREHAAEDVLNFMDALKIPACHIFGVSMGCCIGLQVAITYPTRVLSLFDVSPLPLEEPQEVAEGRQEIYNCWAHGVQNGEKESIDAAIYGGMQLAFNNRHSNLIAAITSHFQPFAKKNWDAKHLEGFHATTVGFFVNRKRHPQESLAKIRCPVILCHCGDDIAYTLDNTQEFLGCLEKAGVSVQMHHVLGSCHYGSLTDSHEINTIFYNSLLSLTQKDDLGPIPSTVKSPYEDGLVKSGLNPNGDDSDDDY